MVKTIKECGVGYLALPCLGIPEDWCLVSIALLALFHGLTHAIKDVPFGKISNAFVIDHRAW